MANTPGAVASPADWELKARRVNGLSLYAHGRAVKVIAETIRKSEHGEVAPYPYTSMLEKIQSLAKNRVTQG